MKAKIHVGGWNSEKNIQLMHLRIEEKLKLVADGASVLVCSVPSVLVCSVSFVFCYYVFELTIIWHDISHGITIAHEKVSQFTFPLLPSSLRWTHHIYLQKVPLLCMQKHHYTVLWWCNLYIYINAFRLFARIS